MPSDDLVAKALHLLGLNPDDPEIKLYSGGNERPNVIGGPEPPQLSLPQAQAQLTQPAAPSFLTRGTNAVLDALGALRPETLAREYAAAGPVALGGALQEAKGAYDVASADHGRPSLAEMSPALSKILHAAGTTAMPLIAPALVGMAPGALGLMAAGGLAAGLIGKGVQKGATKLGVDPRTSALIGDVTSYLPPEHLAGPIGAKLGLAAMAAMPLGTRALRKAVEEAGSRIAADETSTFAAPTVKKLLEQLPEKSSAKLLAYLKDSPDKTDLVRHLTAHEAHLFGLMTADQKAEFGRIADGLPPGDYFKAAAQGGAAKRGWYRASRAAVQWVYQQEQKLFSGTLAATSPQNAVPMNLDNTTRVFRGWVQAGRPTDEASILRIMGENVLGNKGEQSVLGSWKKNTVRVLQNWDAISGPKVNSFWRNLRNDPLQTAMGPIRPQDAVTLDAWMSHLLGVEQTYFSGGVPTKDHLAKKMLDAGNPGYGPGYFAASAKLRKAATESGMTPEEMQETMWSWGKALFEQAEKTGESAVSIIKRDGLDPKRITDTPDFSTLFHDPKYGSAIRDTSKQHAARLATLPKATFPTPRATTPQEKAWMLKAAKVLDDLAGQRARASDFRVGKNAPGSVLVTSAQEGVSGPGTYFAPEIHTKKFTPAQRQTFGREMLDADTDLRGRPVVAHAMGLDTTDTTRGIGYWKDIWGKKQFNALNASGVQVRFAGEAPSSAELAPAITAARTTALFNAQDATAVSGLVYDLPTKDAIHFATGNKVNESQFAGLAALLEKRFPDRQYALINKGGSTQGKQGSALDVLRIDGGQLDASDQRLIEMYLKRKGHAVEGTLGTNIAGDYRGLGDELGPRQSGTLTRMALEHYDALTPKQQKGLDSAAVKAVAAAKLKVVESYGKDITVPPEFLNLYRIVETDGISGLRKVLQDGSQLLPVLVMLGLPTGEAVKQSEPKGKS